MRALAAFVLGAFLLASAGASAETPQGRIVFVRDVGSQSELFSAAADGSGLTRLTRNGDSDTDPKWSPDGRLLLSIGGLGVVIRAPNGSVVRTLANRADYEPRWSPDGRGVAYLIGGCAQPGGRGDDLCADLWVTRADGTGRRRLARGDVDLTQDLDRRYAWAPDGHRLVYTAFEAKALAVVDVSDGRRRILPGTRRVGARQPSWSPDGRWIAFMRQRAPFGGSEIYVVAPDGSRLHRLAATRSTLSSPTWSPDGRRIAYFRDVSEHAGDNRWAVVVARSDGTRRLRLAIATEDETLVWSPDSSRLLWSTFFRRLTVARADGRGRPALVTIGESPDWR